MNDDITEQDLPGIGRRFDVDANEGGRLSVVIHHSGRRDLYVFSGSDEQPAAVLTLEDDRARRLGAVIGGVYFKPASVERIEAVIGGLLIDWATVRQDSPGAGRTIADLEVRRRTGMTIAAVVRGEDAILAPGPEEVLRPGDRIVVVGRPDDLPELHAEVIG